MATLSGNSVLEEESELLFLLSHKAGMEICDPINSAHSAYFSSRAGIWRVIATLRGEEISEMDHN